MNITEACARAAHEVSRVYCLAAGDSSQAPWEQAPEWQRESALKGVQGALAGETPEESHAAWLADKRADGWTYGPLKSPGLKTHPCMLPYASLPPHQRAKDALYLAVVRAMAIACDGKYEREGFKKSSQVAHADHADGRGSAESGPDDPSCPCREEAAACARAGCGFCGAHQLQSANRDALIAEMQKLDGDLAGYVAWLKDRGEKKASKFGSQVDVSKIFDLATRFNGRPGPLTDELSKLVAEKHALLAQARKLLLPLEWLDDRGRECAWCGATRHTFNKPEDVGTERERKERDNHRDTCAWLAFVKATEGMGDK